MAPMNPAAAPPGRPPSPDFRALVPQGFEDWVQIPAFYTASVNVAETVGGVPAVASAKLRPERFVCGRITFATAGDIIFDQGTPSLPLPLSSSWQARAVECTWADNFTQFFGDQPCLLAAVFGDSNGFLDLPGGLLFQGSQTLSVKLNRLVQLTVDQGPSRFDFQFQGIALLPPGQQQSGSVR